MGNQDSFGAAFGRLVKRKRGEMDPKWTQGDLAATLYPNQHDARETRKGDISKLENGKVANPNTTTITKIAKALDISPDEIDALQRQAQMSPAEQLDNIATLPRDALELLASRFEIPTPHRLSLPELQDALSKRAEQYHSYRALIDGLDEHVAAIANLKGAAQDAAERLDFAEVEELLSRVDTVETEIAADTKQARAANALLRGRVQQAYELLEVAADSFGSIDQVEPSRRRMGYAKILFEHGTCFTGSALENTIAMLEKAIQSTNRKTESELWATLYNNLGLALEAIGHRDLDARNLEQSIYAFHKALEEKQRNRYPKGWAELQVNLGNALSGLGKLNNSVETLEQAVTTYQKAFQEFSREEHPNAWATVKINLGSTLQVLGKRKNSAKMLNQSYQAHKSALSVWTKYDAPRKWASVQNNLGNTLAVLGQLKNDISILERAIEHHKNSLLVWRRAAEPLLWASANNNIGTTYGAIANNTSDSHPLHSAVKALNNALQVWTLDELPQQWGQVQLNLGWVCLMFFDKQEKTANLETAEAHVLAAQKVFEQAAPHYAEMAQGLLQQIALRREAAG